ncbi:MAG: hypothetical protein ACWGQW_04700, partial [bacterium]
MPSLANNKKPTWKKSTTCISPIGKHCYEVMTASTAHQLISENDLFEDTITMNMEHMKLLEEVAHSD